MKIGKFPFIYLKHVSCSFGVPFKYKKKYCNNRRKIKKVPVKYKVAFKYNLNKNPPHIIITVVYTFISLYFPCPHKHVYNCKKLARRTIWRGLYRPYSYCGYRFKYFRK